MLAKLICKGIQVNTIFDGQTIAGLRYRVISGKGRRQLRIKMSSRKEGCKYLGCFSLVVIYRDTDQLFAVYTAFKNIITRYIQANCADAQV